MIRDDDWNSRKGFAVCETSKSFRLWMQHAGAFAACLSAFAVGNSLGWSSPAGPQLIKGEAGFPIAEEENSLVGSLLTIGAATSCIPAGYVADRIGRKITLLGLIPIFLLGWALIAWATSVGMIYSGRFLLGLCLGAVCVTAPMYVAEISQKEIRGTVGSYFQLLLAGGILFGYIIGSQLSVFWLSIICGMVPIIFGIIFIFFPETPVHFLNKRDTERARKSLKFYLGTDNDIEQEFFELSEYSNQKSGDQKSNWDVFLSKQGIKSLTMCIGLMIFQQFTGINAILFNATDIFENAGGSLEAKYKTIVTGLMQFLGTLLTTFLVDNLGKVTLLVASASLMSVSVFFLGLYFFLLDNNIDVSEFSWLPLISLCVFIMVFSVGFGAIPWMLMPELIPSKIKGSASSIACLVSWLSAFIVTEFFNNLVNTFGRGITFWLFAGMSVLAAIFSYKILPETKGKSLEEIQRQLSGTQEERVF